MVVHYINVMTVELEMDGSRHKKVEGINPVVCLCVRGSIIPSLFFSQSLCIICVKYLYMPMPQIELSL